MSFDLDSAVIDDFQSFTDSADSQSLILVHTKSLSLHLPNNQGFRSFCLKNCEKEMLSARQLYLNLDTAKSLERLDRLDECRMSAHFMVELETRNVKVGAKSCHVRFCPLCGKSRENQIRKKVKSWLLCCKDPKFLTFTLKHSDDPLDVQIDRLYSAFKNIRRHKLLKNAIRGGVWFFQIKKSDSTNQWHPHIHFVVDSDFISNSKLSDAWLLATGDSFIIDIRQVKNPAQVSDYVARYATCPCQISSLSPEDAVILYNALDNRRLCGSVGSAFKEKIMSKPKFEPDKWKRLFSWAFVKELKDEDDSAFVIWQCWQENRPLPDDLDFSHLNDFLLYRHYDKKPPKEATKSYGTFF